MIAATKYNEGLSPLDFIRNRIKSEVKKAGFTYESFARLFNRTEGWFSNIVNKHRGISVEILLEIAEKLNINPHSLLPEASGEEAPQSFEEYIESKTMDVFEKKIISRIESMMMDVFEKKIIPRIEEKLKNNK